MVNMTFFNDTKCEKEFDGTPTTSVLKSGECTYMVPTSSDDDDGAYVKMVMHEGGEMVHIGMNSTCADTRVQDSLNCKLGDAECCVITTASDQFLFAYKVKISGSHAEDNVPVPSPLPPPAPPPPFPPPPMRPILDVQVRFQGELVQNFGQKEATDFVDIFASSSGSNPADVTIERESYVVEMELELSPEDNVTITEENLRKPLLDTLAITFPCNISISEGGEAADETARTLSLDLSRGSSRRMLRMDRRMSRHLLATVQFNVDVEDLAEVRQANEVAEANAKRDSWANDLRAAGLQVAGAALASTPARVLAVDVKASFDSSGAALEARTALMEATQSGTFATRLQSRTGYSVLNLGTDVDVILPPPAPPRDATSPGGGGDSASPATTASPPSTTTLAPSSSSPQNSSAITTTTTLSMADKAKAKAKSLMDEHGDMIVYGSIAGGGLLIAAITFFIVRRCCCSSGNARDTRDVGKRQSRLKQRHMEDRGGGSQFSMKRQMMYKNGVYAPSDRVMHNNWSGDADGNAMDPFNRDGYRQGGRPPRGRTPPMHQRGRQAPPRGFAGGARRSNIADQGGGARFTEYLS